MISPELQALNSHLDSLTLQEKDELLWQEVEKDHYEQRPVDIVRFITDKDYLGSSESFKKGCLPFWMDKLQEVYPSVFYTPKYEIIVDLPIGSGKTYTALAAQCYELYKLLCLKNPCTYLGVDAQVVFCLFSASKSLAQDVNWKYMEEFMTTSPWFQRYCPLPARIGGEGVDLPKRLGIDLGSASIHALGKAVFGGVLDEANFQRVKSEQAQTNYLALLRRMVSRFLGLEGSLPGKLWLLSSRNYSSDFLETRKYAAKESKRSKIIEGVPVWDIRTDLPRCGETFSVFVGDENKDPEILPTPRDGASIYQVPVEYREFFEKDLMASIREVIGCSGASMMNLFRRSAVIDQISTVPHRFSRPTISLEFDDAEDQIIKYVPDQQYFRNPMCPDCLRFWHLDLSVTRDKLGAAAVFVNLDKRVLETNPEKVLTMSERSFIVDVALSIQAKPGQEIPLYKIRDFILLLKSWGYPTALVTADQFQSVDTRQLLKLAGIPTEHLSVDGKDGRLKYIAFANTANRRRIWMTDHPLLKQEAKEIRDYGNRVDHLKIFSKDLLDGVVGAFWNALNARIINKFQLPKEEVGHGTLGVDLEKERLKASTRRLSKEFGFRDPFSK